MRRRGLTVIELMVALSVTGLAATIGAGALALLADRRAVLREVVSPTAHAAAVRRTVVAWLEGAHGTLSPLSGSAVATFQLLDLTARGRAVDQLVFTTSAPTPLGTGDAQVRLYVDDDDRTVERGLVAELSSWPGGPSARVMLDSTVAELDARCLTDMVGSRTWLPTYLSSQLVPRGVELRLRAVRAGELHPLLQLPITVAVEAGR